MKSAKLRYCQTAGKYSLFVCVCVCHLAVYVCVWSVPVQCSWSSQDFEGFFYLFGYHNKQSLYVRSLILAYFQFS